MNGDYLTEMGKSTFIARKNEPWEKILFLNGITYKRRRLEKMLYKYEGRI